MTAFWLVSKIQIAPDVLKEPYLKTNNDETAQETKWQERIWVLAVAGQAGLFIAFPVLLGLVAGYFLDRLLGTYILFAVLLVVFVFRNKKTVKNLFYYFLLSSLALLLIILFIF